MFEVDRLLTHCFYPYRPASLYSVKFSPGLEIFEDRALTDTFMKETPESSHTTWVMYSQTR